MKVIALVGMPGSGKSLVSNYLKERGCAVIYFGELILSETKKRGLEINPENEKIVREDIRHTYGMAACAILSLPKIDEELINNRKICIDGLYSFSEYKVLKNHLGDDLVLIAVACQKSLRYFRLENREFRPLTREQAENRDFSEIENLEKGGPIAIADYTVVNDQTEVELIENIKKILWDIWKE